MQLTSQGSFLVTNIAQRYGLSEDAVITMLYAVYNGGGTMAQFSHPELGGAGQWMQGGMTMVGDMFNYGLKAKVDNLCSELANALANQLIFAPPPVASFNSNTWWPAEWGSPSASGAQNNFRYAIFPNIHRLAIENNGQLTLYDTLDHQIGGIGQQQGSGSSVTFSSQYGTVPLNNLPIVNTAGNAVYPTDNNVFNANVPSVPINTTSNDTDSDVLSTIERLAELHRKGILSDGEFAAKKAELLARL
jgi:hypothetical protein